MKILNIIIILFFLSGCTREKEVKFEEGLNYFDDTFIDHFPVKIKHIGSVQAVSQNISNAHPHVWLKYYPGKIRLDSIESSAELRAIGKYSSDDTCLIVIDKHLTSKNWYKIDKKIRNPKLIEYGDLDCHKGKFPVPNFYGEWWAETEKTLTKLEGYTMYVLEAKKGIHMDPKKLPNGLYTPLGWEHGISKGIAINKKTGAVIYWADIW
ncbi:hypothetical protein ACFSKL_02795 [Belliella marina]|uniref:Uncharacterized protein n=1 Tax=Belliella marina TaxID=1644146 RepID=A0ABW4VG88_9BACT